MRKCTYLRIKLTERCNLRCPWCHGEGAIDERASVELSPEQIAMVTRLLADLGFHKIKLTGGEPTMRNDLDEIIRLLSTIPGVDLSLMTNGTLLTSERLTQYRLAGLRRINVSINTVNPLRFAELQGGNDELLDRAVGSIERILALGYESPKVNFLYLGSQSDSDLQSIIDFAQEKSIKVTILNILPYPYAQSCLNTNLTIAEVIDTVMLQGVKRVYLDRDPNSFATLGFVLDNDVVLEVLHHQTGQSDVYGSCAECEVRFSCLEGVFAQRLTTEGFLQPCLIRNDNSLDLRPYLLGEMREGDAQDLVRTYLAEL